MIDSHDTSVLISQQYILSFQEKVFLFYQTHGRDLPWRKTTDPYKILLSELMLQQTQVSRVVLYYERWIVLWPTVHALASAPRALVLDEWMGLGYNTRSVNLHKAAQIIVREFDGDVLAAINQYQKIPGVGRYTSQAVQIFSTNVDQVTVDTNIRRIFIQEFHLSETISDKELWTLAQQCLPKGRSRDWHNALMDYGALYLTSKRTGIKPKTRQTRFEGSDRQIRARILRLMLQNQLTFLQLEKMLGVERMRLTKILEKMIKEQLLLKKNNRYQLNQ